MRYYRLVRYGEIVDAIDSEAAGWLVENPRSLSIYTGTEEAAKGVLSTDGQTVWHIEGREPFGDYPDFPTAALEEIGPEEYRALREELDAGNAPAVPAAEDETPAEELPAPEPKTRLRRMEAQVAALEEQNAMLTECLLEMSEILYS